LVPAPRVENGTLGAEGGVLAARRRGDSDLEAKGRFVDARVEAGLDRNLREKVRTLNVSPNVLPIYAP
jgi:hypothetical protein